MHWMNVGILKLLCKVENHTNRGPTEWRLAVKSKQVKKHQPQKSIHDFSGGKWRNSYLDGPVPGICRSNGLIKRFWNTVGVTCGRAAAKQAAGTFLSMHPPPQVRFFKSPLIGSLGGLSLSILSSSRKYPHLITFSKKKKNLKSFDIMMMTKECWHEAICWVEKQWYLGEPDFWVWNRDVLWL